MQETVNALSLETEKLRSEMMGLNRLADNFGQTITRSFASAIIHGRKLSDVLKGLALSLGRAGALIGAEAIGRIGGKHFALCQRRHRKQPHIISPARRRRPHGRSGRRSHHAPGARRRRKARRAHAGGGQALNVTVNISTPDVASFRQSQSQVASMITRAVSRGQRNL